MWFNIDYNKLSRLLLFSFLRKTINLILIDCLITPFVTTYNNWKLYREANLYNLQHNGQVCYLQKVLNDKYDNSLRRIYIIDSDKFQRLYIYTTAEDKPLYLGNVYLKTAADYADDGNDFTVVLPLAIDLASIEHTLTATINYYKLASKRYNIKQL